MEYKICPICDQKMTRANYCEHCRQRVRHPLTINVDYYLNERHPDTDHDCSYHDYHDPAYNMPSQQNAGQPARQTTASGRTARRTAQRTVPNQPRKPSGSPRTGARNALLAIIIMIFVFATAILSAFFSMFYSMRQMFPGGF